MNETTKLKLAFVKQDVFADLYVGLPGDKNAYLNSLQRSGPLAFFTAFDAQLFIVSADESADTWKEKVRCCNHKSYAEWENVRHKKNVVGESELSQFEIATPMSEIKFEEFDIVICVDACIPPDVAKQYSNVLWAYYISEPCMDSYKFSKEKCLPGYDVFLNQMFRPLGHQELKEFSKNSHEIDFPYAFVYPNIYADVYSFEEKHLEKNETALNVVIPNYVKKLLSKEQISRLKTEFNILTPTGNIRDFLHCLHQGDIYLRLGGQGKFGNETVEAVCSDLLFLSTERGWKNRVFNIDGAKIPGVDFNKEQVEFAINRLRELNVNRDELNFIKASQQKIALNLCFERPLKQLLQKYKEKLNVQAHLHLA